MEEMPLLTHREARILRLYYGFGDDPAMTYAEIASLLEITPGRVRQINLKTIRKLRWMSENQGLLDPFRSMDDLRKERDTVRAEHARIYHLHTNLETVHANLCDAVSTGNLERAQRVLGIPVEQPEASNPNLSKRWDKINISVRLKNLLLDADVDYVWQACVKSEDWWLARKNFGRKTLNELKEILQGMRLHLGMDMSVLRSQARIDGRP
jgi:DNA-binding CsgD family transcriptional regulator